VLPFARVGRRLAVPLARGEVLRDVLGVPAHTTEPVHQITFDTSMTRPSSKVGNPSRTLAVLGTRSIPAAASSFGLTRSSGAAIVRAFGRTFRPIGVLVVSTCEAKTQKGA
jgi:hypothetical protein